MHPVQVPAGGGKPVNILGIPMLIRLHGRDTNGTLAVVESHDAPGGGPPPHIHHREDETFQILEGDYEFMVGGQTIHAQPGTTLFAPRDVPHAYRCVSPNGGKLSVVLTPAGFEGFFEQVGALTPAQQQDIPRVLEIGKKYGLEILPPPGA
jgi:quercetin dioxygenase-like cupin family protein